ncbi:hypothetical protein BaRGS_00023011, partial [Batillaria attramentaria]
MEMTAGFLCAGLNVRCLWCLLILWCGLLTPKGASATPHGTRAVSWTLYRGLKLTWNEASSFCNDQGGHLPVPNTKLTMNGIADTIKTWADSGQMDLS